VEPEEVCCGLCGAEIRATGDGLRLEHADDVDHEPLPMLARVWQAEGAPA
jgi:hypothetical protein